MTTKPKAEETLKACPCEEWLNLMPRNLKLHGMIGIVAECPHRRTPAKDEGERSLCEHRYYTPRSIIQRCKHPKSYDWKCCKKVCEKLPDHIDKLECVDCPEPNCEDRVRGCEFKPTAPADEELPIMTEREIFEENIKCKVVATPCPDCADLQAALAEKEKIIRLINDFCEQGICVPNWQKSILGIIETKGEL